MHRLRHPIRSITEPYGKAGLTVAILALVLATTGAAFAAGVFTKKQEKKIIAIAKKYAGKPGAIGPAGPAGTNGTNGKDGAQGEKGEKGADGTNGTNGKSVTLTTEPEGTNCTTGTGGGVKVEIESTPTSKKFICNGKEGSPWTAGGTLPKGKTETGMWLVTATLQASPGNVFGNSVVSFNIPLKSAPTAVLVDEEEELGNVPKTHATECPGSRSEPKAAEGVLCFYTQSETASVILEEGHPFGGFLAAKGPAIGAGSFGSWAVTSSE